MKNIRRLQHSDFARIEHDLVIERGSQLALRNLNAAIRGLIYPASGLSAVILEGLMATPGSGLSVDVSAPGVAVQAIEGDDVSIVADKNNGDDWNVILDAADPTNPRIDILQAQVRTRSEFTDAAVDIVDVSTKTITPQTKDRDWEVYLHIEKVTGTPAGSPSAPSVTAGTAGSITGSVTISGTIDLSTRYILNVAIGVDGEFVEVDCRGASPAATTIAEIISAINTALGAAYATNSGSDEVVITDIDTASGENSIVKIKQPTDPSLDAYGVILGGTLTTGYYDTFPGSNGYFKIAEINVGAAAVSLTSTNILDRTEKASWNAGASTIANGTSLEAHRDSVPMDHALASVEDYHLAASAITAINSKLTKYRGAYAPIYIDPSDELGARLRGRVHVADIQCVDESKNNLTLGQIEQVYPVSRIDQSQTNYSGGTYNLLTALSEAAADKIVFSPNDTLLFADNHSRAAFWIASAGSGYTAIRIELHDSVDNQLATQDIAIGDISAPNWHYVDLVATLDVLQDYHYHIYIVGFTAGASPTIGTDAGANQAFKQMYKPDAGLTGGANWNDVIKILDSAGVSCIAARGSTADDLAYQGDTAGDKSASTVDVMAVDLSNAGTWSAWYYANYVGIDLVNGRIKLPASMAAPFDEDIVNFRVEFNVLEALDDLDDKSILRHGLNQSVADKLIGLEGEDAIIIKTGGTIGGDCHHRYIPQTLLAGKKYIIMPGTYTLQYNTTFEAGAQLIAFIPWTVTIQDYSGYRFIIKGDERSGGSSGTITSAGAGTPKLDVAGVGTNFANTDIGRELWLTDPTGLNPRTFRRDGTIAAVSSTILMNLANYRGYKIVDTAGEGDWQLLTFGNNTIISGLMFLPDGTAGMYPNGMIDCQYIDNLFVNVRVVGGFFNANGVASNSVFFKSDFLRRSNIFIEFNNVSIANHNGTGGANEGIVNITTILESNVRIKYSNIDSTVLPPAATNYAITKISGVKDCDIKIVEEKCDIAYSGSMGAIGHVINGVVDSNVRVLFDLVTEAKAYFSSYRNSMVSCNVAGFEQTTPTAANNSCEAEIYAGDFYLSRIYGNVERIYQLGAVPIFTVEDFFSSLHEFRFYAIVDEVDGNQLVAYAGNNMASRFVIDLYSYTAAGTNTDNLIYFGSSNMYGCAFDYQLRGATYIVGAILYGSFGNFRGNSIDLKLQNISFSKPATGGIFAIELDATTSGTGNVFNIVLNDIDTTGSGTGEGQWGHRLVHLGSGLYGFNGQILLTDSNYAAPSSQAQLPSYPLFYLEAIDSKISIQINDMTMYLTNTTLTAPGTQRGGIIGMIGNYMDLNVSFRNVNIVNAGGSTTISASSVIFGFGVIHASSYGRLNLDIHNMDLTIASCSTANAVMGFVCAMSTAFGTVVSPHIDAFIKECAIAFTSGTATSDGWYFRNANVARGIYKFMLRANTVPSANYSWYDGGQDGIYAGCQAASHSVNMAGSGILYDTTYANKA